MYISLTFLIITSLASSVSFMILLMVQRLFDCLATWIYNLMKVIVIFYLFPAICFAIFIFARALIENSYLMGNPDFTSGIIYNVLTLNNVYYGNLLVNILFLIWILGMIVTFVICIIFETIFVNRIKKNSLLLDDEEARNIIAELKTELKIKKAVKVYWCSAILSPFTSGIFRPIIVLPNLKYNSLELRLILKHEMIHLKRRDVLYKMLGAIVRIVHWFNFSSYLFVNKMYEYSELACDARVLENENSEVRTIYARLIVKMLELSTDGKSYITISALEDNEEKIKRRLEKIMRKRTLKRMQKVGLAFLSAIVLAACPIISYASTVGILETQNQMAKEVVLSGTIVDEAVNIVIDDATAEFTIPAGAMVVASVRGDNRIDFDIPAGKQVWLNEVTLGDGYIDVSLTADSVNDSFKVGYVRKKGTGKYTNSTRGSLSQSFKIVADTYHIYIENTSDHDIHVSGRITV